MNLQDVVNLTNESLDDLKIKLELNKKMLAEYDATPNKQKFGTINREHFVEKCEACEIAIQMKQQQMGAKNVGASQTQPRPQVSQPATPVVNQPGNPTIRQTVITPVQTANQQTVQQGTNLVPTQNINQPANNNQINQNTPTGVQITMANEQMQATKKIAELQNASYLTGRGAFGTKEKKLAEKIVNRNSKDIKRLKRKIARVTKKQKFLKFSSKIFKTNNPFEKFDERARTKKSEKLIHKIYTKENQAKSLESKKTLVKTKLSKWILNKRINMIKNKQRKFYLPLSVMVKITGSKSSYVNEQMSRQK